MDTQSIRTDYAEVIPDETPHGCYEGWQFVGYFVEDENGEHVEEIERVPCRRCKAASSTTRGRAQVNAPFV